MLGPHPTRLLPILYIIILILILIIRTHHHGITYGRSYARAKESGVKGDTAKRRRRSSLCLPPPHRVGVNEMGWTVGGGQRV